MKKSYLLAIAAVALIGCGGDDDKKSDAGQDMSVTTHDMAQNGTDGMTADVVPCTGSNCTTVAGFSVDIDKLAGYYAMNPSATAEQIIQNSCVPNTPVHALYDDGSGVTETVMTDVATNLCAYTLHAVVGKTVHLIAENNAANAVLNTYSQDPTVVAAGGVTQIPAHVCTSNPYSAPVGVAAALGVDVTEVQSHGICMYGTDDVFTPPFVALTPSTVGTVTPAGFTVYSMTDPTTTPPTFVAQNDSMIGIHGIYNASNTAKTTVSITVTADSGSNTYPTFSCDVLAGYITFGPVNPN